MHFCTSKASKLSTIEGPSGKYLGMHHAKHLADIKDNRVVLVDFPGCSGGGSEQPDPLGTPGGGSEQPDPLEPTAQRQSYQKGSGAGGDALEFMMHAPYSVAC